MSIEHKKAINILLELLNKYSLTEPEKEAVLTAIGVLGWTSLAESKLKARKAKRDRQPGSASS